MLPNEMESVLRPCPECLFTAWRISVETGEPTCEVCDVRGRANDAEAMELELKERLRVAEQTIKDAHAKLDEYDACKYRKCEGFPVMTLAERIRDLQCQAWAKGRRQGWEEAESDQSRVVTDPSDLPEL